MSHPKKFSRRQVLGVAALGALGAFVAACQRVIAPMGGARPLTPVPTKILSSAGQGDGVPITMNNDFFVTSIGPAPAVPQDWKLVIAGSVNRELKLSLDEIRAMPAVTAMRTLECISNPVGGELISNAVWKGVRLKDLLTQAGVKPSAAYLKMESLDLFSTGIPLELGMDAESLLVYEMNGEPLPPDHGAPLRCLFPGRYGMKQPKWIEKITLVDTAYAGFWEKQGWSHDAFLLPFSRIDSPKDLGVVDGQTFTISGIAFSGREGIAKLEISGGDSGGWQAAELVRGPSTLTWSTWKWTGARLSSGKHQFWVRVTDNLGRQQIHGAGNTFFGDTFPNGTDQMHSIVLEFKG